MPRAFYLVIAAQFLSALADNALLILAIARLTELAAAAWLVPLLKLSFTLCYVFLAPFTGPLADAWPKGRVMLLANSWKACAVFALLAGADPALAMGIAGLGAAIYGPAKYGLITELLPPQLLVRANGFIEASTVCAVILGTVAGGLLVSPALRAISLSLSGLDWPGSATTLRAGMGVVLALYALAALLNLAIPCSGAVYPRHARHPLQMARRFLEENHLLWRDPLGRVSMAVTTLLWGIGATLQLVVLRWAAQALGLALDQAAYLQGVTALGVVAGSVLASRHVRLAQATRVLPLGIAMGLLVPCMVWVHSAWVAALLLMAFGALAGFFVVPMNALLQHRGSQLLSAGRSIAVQGFNENAGMLAMLALYAGATAMNIPLAPLLWCFGLMVAGVMALIMRGHRKDCERNKPCLETFIKPSSI
jgi:MFS family permease